MKAAFGLVSLLVVLAIVGLLATRQKSAVLAMPDTPASAAAPQGNAREQAQQIQQQVRDDLQRALDQGQSRRDEADK